MTPAWAAGILSLFAAVLAAEQPATSFSDVTICIAPRGTAVRISPPDCLARVETLGAVDDGTRVAVIRNRESLILAPLPGAPSAASEARLVPDSGVELAFDLNSRADATWTLEITGADSPVTITLSEPDFLSIRKIALPPGVYDVVGTAPGFKPVVLKGLRVDAKPAAVGRVKVERLPKIEGIVSDDSTGLAISGAELRGASEKLLAVTDAEGHFQVHPMDRLGVMEVRHPAYARLRIPVPDSDRPIAIRLVPGGSLFVAVVGFAGDGETADVVLFRDTTGDIDPDRKSVFEEVARARVHGAEPDARFERLTPGKYWATLRGETPTQQMMHSLVVENGLTTERWFAIERIPFALEVIYGPEDPLSAATVSIRKPNSPWEARHVTDSGGLIRGELWEPGLYQVAVRHERLRSPYSSSLRIRAAGLVTLRIPDRSLSATLLPCDDAQKLDGAVLHVETRTAKSTLSYQLQPDREGRFVLSGVEAGEYELTPISPAGSRGEPATVTIAPDDRDKSIELRLCVPRTVRIRVTDENGASAPDAILFDDETRWVSGVAGDGFAEFPIGTREAADLFVFSPGKTFTFARIGASSDGVTIVLPAGMSRVRLSTTAEDGQPIRGARVLIRYEGHLLPAAVRDVMETAWACRFETGMNGDVTLTPLPAGHYEFSLIDSQGTREKVPPDAAAVALPRGGFADVHLVFERGER